MGRTNNRCSGHVYLITMKQLILFLLLASGYYCQAQNYACLQNGVTHYFINENGYLRGIRIDSIKTYPDSTVYYPFHTPRGALYVLYAPLSFSDSMGGSWLGKRVKQLPDGIFIFDNYFTDSTVVVKTQANVGDSWVFYKDTGSLFYNATVVSADTMTVLGAVDSIKSILLTAQNASGPVPSDSLNNFKIILSKNNGFVQVFDLYTFPYHKPDSAYTAGLDFFLDRSTLGYTEINGLGGYPPSIPIYSFKITNFIIPNDQQLTNWEPGDIFEWHYQSGGMYPWSMNKILDTVTDKYVSGHSITYTLKGVGYYSIEDKFLNTSETVLADDDKYTVGNYFSFPEENATNGDYLFYFPDDTSYCLSSALFTTVQKRFFPWGLGWHDKYTTYKLGIGKVNYYYKDGEPTLINDYLEAYDNGNKCGRFTFPSAVENINKQIASITIFPNPVLDGLTICSTSIIQQVSITNLLGQTIYRQESYSKQAEVNVAGFASGVYLLKINGIETRRFVKE